MLLGEGTVVAFCGRILALSRWNLTMSRCKCPGVPRGQPPGLAAHKCITLQFRFLCLHVVSININSTSVQTKTCHRSFGDYFLILAKVTLRAREQSAFSLDFFVCIWYLLILTQPLFKPRHVITSFETTVWYWQKILCVWESKQIVHVNNLTEICSSPTRVSKTHWPDRSTGKCLKKDFYYWFHVMLLYTDAWNMALATSLLMTM